MKSSNIFICICALSTLIILNECTHVPFPEKSGNENSNNISESPEKPSGDTESVIIGPQQWSKKNLDKSSFRNGDTIQEAKTDEEWIQAGEAGKPVWCYYDNDSVLGSKYGKLYNWYAVNDVRGLAPRGWHIPSDTEWDQLTDFLGGEKNSGTKMKSKEGWIENGNGTNESGFTGLSGGYRSYNGLFEYIGYAGYWWTSTEYLTYLSWNHRLFYLNGNAVRDLYGKDYGFSVRCIKDKDTLNEKMESSGNLNPLKHQ